MEWYSVLMFAISIVLFGIAMFLVSYRRDEKLEYLAVYVLFSAFILRFFSGENYSLVINVLIILPVCLIGYTVGALLRKRKLTEEAREK